MILFKKNNFKVLFALACGLGASGAYAEQSLVSAPAEQVYAPKGFDSNDVTQVIVSGYLPNLCYKSPQSTFQVKDNTISIQLNAIYEEVSGGVCPQMIVPFLEVVSVGVLAEGTYNVSVNEGTANVLQDSITVVKTSNPEVNDHIYARVDSIERPGLTQKVLLKGYNPSDCLELAEIRAIPNDKNTYSVLPIMKKIRDNCPRKMVPFTYEWLVPKDLESSSILLHARTMLGNSRNFLFTNLPEIRREER